MADAGEPDRRSVVSSSSKVTKERLRRAIPLLAPVSAEEDSSAEELWFDLLLDLALAATYSNLTGNTSVYTELDAVSYLGFFLLLWWIWTSQVCYNTRFRQNDWAHRVYLILQLCVFGALSTFTANFDVTDQIIDSGGPDGLSQLNATLIANDYTSNSIILDAVRRKQLPPINNRGISGALGCSRLILLVPYLVVWWRTRKFPKPNTSVVPIICSLIFSSAMHFTTYGLLTNGGRNEAIAKVVLWYSSILIEVIAHYVDIGFKQGQSYPMDAELFNRASTLMTVIIGEGVNAITGAFHYIVGNIGINAYTLFNMVCTAAIVFCQFTLYFEGGSTPSHHNFSAFSKLGIEGSKRWNRNFRALTWLIAHALYFACLILFMQSVTSILAFQNLQTAANGIWDGLHKVQQIIVPAGVSVAPMDANIEASLVSNLAGLGVPWYPVKEVFTNTSNSVDERMSAYFKFEGELYWYLASLYGSTPEPDSYETYNFQNFTSSVNVTEDQYRSVLHDIFTPRARSTLWLPGSSGGTLIALGLLNAVQRHPPDIYAWLSLLIRMSVGAVVVLSTLGNNGSEPYPLFDDPTSAVWRFLKSGWLLPALAAIYIVQVVFDYILVYAAVKRAKIVARRKARRASTNVSVAPSTAGDPDDKDPDPSIAASPDYGDPPPFPSPDGKFMMTDAQLEKNGMTGDSNTPSDDNPNYSHTGPVPIIANPLNPKQRKRLSKQLDSSSRTSSSADVHTPTTAQPPRPTSRLGRQVSIVETPKADRRQSFGESTSAPASRRPSMSAASSDGEQRPSRSYLTADADDEPQPSRSYAAYAGQASGSSWSPPETIGSGTVPGAGRPSLLEQAAMSPKLDRRQSNKLERNQSGSKLEKREKKKSLTTSDGASSLWPGSEMTRTPSRRLQRKSGPPQEMQYPVIDRPQATYSWD